MSIQPRLALLSLCTLAFVIACGDSSGPPAVASVDVSAPGSSLIIGQQVTLSATARDAKGAALTGRPVTWSSSNTAVASVSSSGVVTGVTAGSASISAAIGGKTGSQIVTVIPPPVASVTVTLASTTIQRGLTTQATAVLRDAANNVLTDRPVNWSSSNPLVASVSTLGVVTALAAGNATIIGTAESQSGAAQLTVTGGDPADAPQITSITPATIVEGGAATITGSKFGATATDNVVKVGGVAASVTAVSPTSLQIIVPKLECRPAGAVTIDVTVNGNTSDPKSQPFAPATTFSLAQGQQALLASPADFCLQFPSTTNTESYLIGVQSTSEVVSNVTPALVIGEGPSGAVVTAPATLATSPVFTAPLVDPAAAAGRVRRARHHDVEAALISQDREALAGRFGAARVAARTRRASFSTVPTVPATPNVGDVLTIRIPNRNTSSVCLNSISLTVTVKAVGAHGIIVEDNANPTGGFTSANYQTLSDQFDSQIYATDAAYFGEATDIDNNGRVVIVITKEVNKTANLLGEVFPSDLYPQSVCPASNEGEFFYGKAPDPTGAAGVAYSVDDALTDAPLIIAHELAHVIQLGRRIAYEPATAFQQTWELEGQATFAEEVNGYTVTGLTPGQNLGFEVAFNNPANQPISWFVDPFVDLAVYYGFQSQTVRVLGAPEQCSWLGTRSEGNTGPCLTGREPYGVPWSFLRYLSDQFGSQFPDGEKGLQRALIENAFTGYATITSVIGVPMDVLLARWAASLYLDDRFVGVDPKLTIPSWNLFAIEQRLVSTARLTPRVRPFAAFTDQVSVRAGSTAYFLVSGAGRNGTGIRVRDASGSPLPDYMRIWVVRVQ